MQIFYLKAYPPYGSTITVGEDDAVVAGMFATTEPFEPMAAIHVGENFQRPAENGQTPRAMHSLML